MADDAKRVTIGFELVDKNGYRYSARSSFKYFEEPVINELGEMFNTFLKQAGYIRNNDYIFMEDVTEEERDAIADFLSDFRAAKERRENER